MPWPLLANAQSAILVDLDPCRQQLCFRGRQVPFQVLATRDGNNAFIALVLDMNMRQVMLLGIKKIHVNDQAEKHADDRHRCSFQSKPN